MRMVTPTGKYDIEALKNAGCVPNSWVWTVCNRLLVAIQRPWSYIAFDGGARLITGKDE
jgi:hypothetical protein